MHENECIAPAANTNARSIPTDDVVEKLGFMVFVAFYMYVGRVRPDATFFYLLKQCACARMNRTPMPACTTTAVLCLY
jgi:hypothetical protein